MTTSSLIPVLALLALVTVGFLLTVIRGRRSVIATTGPEPPAFTALRYLSLVVGLGLLFAVAWSTWRLGVSAYTQQKLHDLELRVAALEPPDLESPEAEHQTELTGGRAILYLVLVECFREPRSGEETFRLRAVKDWDVVWPTGRNRMLSARFKVAGGFVMAEFAPRELDRYGDASDGILVRMNGMRFRHIRDGRIVSGGSISPGYLDVEIRRLHGIGIGIRQRGVRLSLVHDVPAGMPELYGFLRFVRDDDPLTKVTAAEFLEEEGFFETVKAQKRSWPSPRWQRTHAKAGLIPFIVRTELAGVALLAAELALAGASRRRAVGAVLAFLLVVLFAVAVDGTLVSYHRGRLEDLESTVAERAVAATGLQMSFFFGSE